MTVIFSPFAKTGIFVTVYRRRTAKKNFHHVHESPAHNVIVLTLDIDATFQPILLFVLYTRHPPSFNALCDPA